MSAADDVAALLASPAVAKAAKQYIGVMIDHFNSIGDMVVQDSPARQAATRKGGFWAVRDWFVQYRRHLLVAAMRLDLDMTVIPFEYSVPDNPLT